MQGNDARADVILKAIDYSFEVECAESDERDAALHALYGLLAALEAAENERDKKQETNRVLATEQYRLMGAYERACDGKATAEARLANMETALREAIPFVLNVLDNGQTSRIRSVAYDVAERARAALVRLDGETAARGASRE